MLIAVLFARKDSPYKTFPDFDVWDVDRDARTFFEKMPVIAHPPCRAWGQLSQMANHVEGEKQLAFLALAQVRLNGGILEHPLRSKLWNEASLPIDDEIDLFGGYTIVIDQWHFGHVARKPTNLYIVGVPREKLPSLPHRHGLPRKTICGINGQPGRRCTQYEREYTPTNLILWLRKVALMVGTR